MSSKQITEILKLAEENPTIVSNLLKVPNVLKDIFDNKTVAETVPSVGTGIELPQLPQILQTSNGLSKIFNIRTIITIILVIWAVIMIVVRFAITDQERKKDIVYISDLLFGNIGIIPVILSVWAISILIVTLLPLISSVTPKLEDMLLSVTKAIKLVTG